jgi:hypothetical protein
VNLTENFNNRELEHCDDNVDQHTLHCRSAYTKVFLNTRTQQQQQQQHQKEQLKQNIIVLSHFH